MTARSYEKEEEKIEELAVKAEMSLEEDDSRKDLKEKRGIIKQTLFDGSKKLKHIIPKGKHL
jgi:tRNA(Ile)-lysidine synthase TilS/MesJ